MQASRAEEQAGLSVDPRPELKEELRKLLWQTLKEETGSRRPRTLAQLRLLLAIAEQLAPEKRKSVNWLNILIVSAVALLVAMTATIQRPSVEVDLNLKVSGFEATLGKKHTLLKQMEVTLLTITDARKLRVPAPSTSLPVQHTAPQGSGLRLVASLPPNSSTRSKIELDHITVPAATHLAVSASSPRGLVLDLTQTKTQLQADLSGSIDLNIPGKADYSVSLDGAAAVSAWSGERLGVDLQATQAHGCIVCSPTPVSELSFDSRDETRDDTSIVVTPYSSILSGSVVLRDLEDKEISLRPGTHLVMKIENGELRSASLGENGELTIAFHGRVSNLVMGVGESARALTPSYLEWIAVNKTIELMWSAVIFMLTLLASTAKSFWTHS